MDLATVNGKPVILAEEFETLFDRLTSRRNLMLFGPYDPAVALGQALSCMTMVAAQGGDWYLSRPVEFAFRTLYGNAEIYRRVVERVGSYVRRIGSDHAIFRAGTSEAVSQTGLLIKAKDLPVELEYWQNQEPAPAFLVACRVIASVAPITLPQSI